MDETITAVAAALGSAIGAAATIVTSLLIQRRVTTHEDTLLKLRERENLYREFVSQASRLAVEAASSSLERPEQLTALYGILSQIRLVSEEEVLTKAEDCCRQIVNLYRQPNMTAEQLRDAYEANQLDPLKEFSACCRKELLAMS